MYKDIFGKEIKDMDAVVSASHSGKLTAGIYYNNRVIDIDNLGNDKYCITHANITQVGDVMVIDKKNMQEKYDKIVRLNSKEFNAECKEIAVNDLVNGGIYETKTGVQYIYLGDDWKLYSYKKNIRNGAYRRCFFKPGKEKYVSKGKNLEQLINEAIESIDDGTDGMLRFFKFSTPKLYRFVGMIDEDVDELNDFKAFGHMGVIDNNIKDFTFLETYNRRRITDRSYDMYFRTGYGARIEFDYDPEIGRDDDKYFERTLNAIKQAGTTHGILVRE